MENAREREEERERERQREREQRERETKRQRESETSVRVRLGTVRNALCNDLTSKVKTPTLNFPRWSTFTLGTSSYP